MKKRFPALFLALALCLGLAVPAFAADTSAELYTYISAASGSEYPYVNYEMEYQFRTVDSTYKFGEAQKDKDIFMVVPTSEYFQVGVYNLAEGEHAAVQICAYSDPDGDGVYDLRLFQEHTEKVTLENGETVDSVVSADVLPLPEGGAYKATGKVAARMYAVVMPGFEEVEDGNYAFSAAQLYELFGDNTFILFVLGEDYLGGVLLSEGAFPDVPGLGWYSDTVAWAAEKGIAVGSDDGNFMPGDTCTHIQILTFLSRAAGNTNAADYDWTTEQIMVMKWAKEKGMIGEGFDPSKPCTRAEAVNYIWQAKDKPSAAASNFTDMKGYENYAKAVDWANEKKITTGVGNNMFAPGDTCNRAYIVTFLYRAYNN